MFENRSRENEKYATRHKADLLLTAELQVVTGTQTNRDQETKRILK